MLFILPILVVGGALFLVVTFVHPFRTVQQTVDVGWLNFLVVAVAGALAWRRTGSALNRDLIVASVAGIGLVLAHRLLAQAGGVVEIGPMLRDDCLIVAAVAAAVRVPIAYGRLAAFVIMTLTAVALSRWPAWASEIFSVGATTMLLTLATPLVVAARNESGDATKAS
jgi:hypothetical protein